MKKNSPFISLFYAVTFFFVTLSGFAQMPIFKRYYIADIPGLGWLANFYITHVMHYIFAGIFIGLVVFSLSNFIFSSFSYRKNIRITKDTIIKTIIFSGLILTGIPMVIKNFSGTPFSYGTIITLDLSHLFFCMSLIIFGIYLLIKPAKKVL